MRRCFLAGAVFLLLCPHLRGAQSIQQRLQTKVQNYNLSEPTFLEALLKAAADFKLPMGVELVKSPSVLRPVKRSWRQATAMEILTALVRGEKGYRLRVDDGIVHVFQKEIVSQRSNFLNIRIRRFDAQSTTGQAAGTRLWMLVNARFQPPKPPTPGPHGTMSSGLGNLGDRTFSLDLRDTTVRGVMDALAVSSEYKIWVVAFALGKSLMPSGFQRTVSPTKPGPTSDAGQPGWESLKWGEKPY